ncbi:MAG: hypothetical protein ACE15D_11880 [Candidatus Eisenbacteria bacterium]
MNRAGCWIPAGLVLGAMLAFIGTAAAVTGVPSGDLGVPLDVDNNTLIDVNNIAMFVTNSGGFARDLESPGGPSGLFFPRGTDKTAVYAAGLWVGAKVNGEVRVTVAEYDLEYQPGKIYNDNGTITYDSPADPRLRVYKIVKGDTESEDYLNWPVADGAPVDAEGNPQFVGDQTLWAVYNDANPATHTNNAAGTAPMDLEVQQTTFAFDRPAPLGNMIFVKLKMINKGNDTLEDAYVSVWSDPDLGGAGDDLVGADTTLSMGYVYNDTNNDEIYGGSPPAVGYDFFQGPIVPSPGDTAYVSGRPVPDYRNLPMTSFAKYINGTDPTSPNESYNYMQGLKADGSQLINPVTGRVTTFMHTGDPVAGTGWLDDNAADRRLMLSSGPFTMAPGDTQEVVTAIIVAQGSNRLSSVDLLKLYDEQAQAVFDVNFRIPSAPPRPSLYAVPGDKAIDLIWGTEADNNVQSSEELGEEYHHEGFNVYQGESIAGPWHKIFTFDVADSVGLIYGDQFNVDLGGPQRVILQNGTNNGLVHQVHLTQDMILGGPLRNYKEYFYAVTAYSYDVNHVNPFFIGPNQVGWITPALENSPQGVVAIPKSSSAVLSLAADRVSGTSDGSVQVTFTDPNLIENGEYEVTFRDDPELGSVWDLTNVATGEKVLEGQTLQSSNPNEYGYPIVDGMMVRVLGPAPGFKRNLRDPSRPMIDEIIHGDGTGGGTPVTPDQWGGPGNDLWWSINSTSEWGFSAGGGNGGEGRFTRDGADLANLTGADIIMKWDYAEDNVGWWVFDDESWGPVPFGLYLKDPVTGVETRLVPALSSGGGTIGAFDFSPDTPDGQFGAAATDWIYAYTFDGDWDALLADIADGTYDNDTTQNELFARLQVFANVDPPVLPPKGTVIQFSTTKPNTPADVFRFRTFAPGSRAGTVVGNDLDQIRVVPNPYLNQSAYELNQFDRIVRFTNLPAVPVTIRIFTLSGELIRTLHRDDTTSSMLPWDLENDQQIPIASGVYLWHVDAKGVGSKTGKMIVFVEKERLNRF